MGCLQKKIFNLPVLFFSGKPSALYDTSNPDWIPTRLLTAAARQQPTQTGSPSKSKLQRY